MNGHAVVVAGGGPTGMMLAGELALAGIDVAIVERRATQELAGMRAGGLHARTLEVLDQRGIAERFVSQGQIHHHVGFHVMPTDISDFPTRHNYVLALPQDQIERILAGWITELRVPVHRGLEVRGFTQDDAGVDVELSDGRTLRTQYLVGCDGGRSATRKHAGIEFAGWDATTSWLIAELRFRDEPAWGFREDATGIHGIGKIDDGKALRTVLTEPELHPGGDPSLDDVCRTLIAVYGTDFGVHSPIWISRFTDMTRQASAYRERRVLLAGDAAHVHPPMGGQGLNVGVQDAVNLGWKLAQVIRGTSAADLLDTYHAERHPVAARVLRNTMAQVALRRQDERSKALRDTLAEFLRMDEPRKRLAGELSGLDIRYEFARADESEPHPLLGRRMPDLDLATSAGTTRAYRLLHAARPVLLNFSGDAFAIGPWSSRVTSLAATHDGAWELPVIGKIPAPDAVLVRPDGHVAWVGDARRRGLDAALSTWFGAPSAS